MIFYNLFICLLSFGLKVFSWFNEKAKKGVDGRKESLKIVQEKLKNQKVIWMHSASLGEYEQGLPVLEKLKNEHHFLEGKHYLTFPSLGICIGGMSPKRIPEGKIALVFAQSETGIYEFYAED